MKILALTSLSVVLTNSTKTVAETINDTSGTGFSEWSAWGVVVLLLMGILLYEGQRKAREKEFIKGYMNYDDVLVTTHEKNKKTGLRLFGEYLGEFYNEERKCYEMRFRSGVSHYFTVFSNDPMAEYKEVHFLERNYWIYYSINAQIYKKKLKVEDYYERKIGYTLQAYIYKFVCFCVNLSTSGIIISSISFGSLFAIWFPEIKGLNFLLGCLLGIVFCIVNYSILNYTDSAKNLLKLKIEIVKEEYYLTALEAPEKRVNVYRVWGDKWIEIKTSDESKTLVTKKLEGKRKVDHVEDNGKKRHFKKSNLKGKNFGIVIKKLKENEKVDYVLVKGYDKLYDMILNPHINVEKYELVGLEMIRKTRQEIRDLRHGYLERNKQFAETIFRLQKENARMQKEYVNVREQLHTVEESVDVEVRKLGVRMLKTQEKTRNSIRSIFEELAGDIVGREWDKKLEMVLRKLEMEKQATQTEKLSMLIQAIEQLISMVGQRSNINMSEILEKLKLVPSGAETET